MNENSNQEMINLLNEIGFKLPNIPTSRKYWLLRTEGGEYYQQFKSEAFVSIGWNEVSEKKYTESVNKIEAEKLIQEANPEHKQIGLILGNIKKFFNEINIGDVVLIPSEGSQTISFGIVESDVYIDEPTETQIDEGDCPHFKRRKVKWLKDISKHKLDLKLFKMLQSRHTISNANDYAKEIDSSIYDFYIKGSYVHYSISIHKESNLTASNLRSLTNLPWILDEYVKDTDYDLDTLETTIYIKSPGKQEYIAYGKKGLLWMLGASIAIVALNGGSVEVAGNKIETPGAFEKYIEITKVENQHELEMTKLKNEALIQAPTPEIIEKEEEKEETLTEENQ